MLKLSDPRGDERNSNQVRKKTAGVSWGIMGKENHLDVVGRVKSGHTGGFHPKSINHDSLNQEKGRQDNTSTEFIFYLNAGKRFD